MYNLSQKAESTDDMSKTSPTTKADIRDIELATLRQTVDSFKAEIDRLRDSKQATKRRLIENEAKLADLEKQLAAVNDELEHAKRTNRPVSPMSVVSDEELSVQALLLGANNDLNQRLALTKSCQTTDNDSDTNAEYSDRSIRAEQNALQEQARIDQAERRCVAAEQDAEELRRQLDEKTTELDDVRIERDRLADKLAEAIRPDEPSVSEKSRSESRDSCRFPTDFQQRIDRNERSFERFVALQRELNEVREVNEKLREVAAGMETNDRRSTLGVLSVSSNGRQRIDRRITVNVDQRLLGSNCSSSQSSVGHRDTMKTLSKPEKRFRNLKSVGFSVS